MNISVNVSMTVVSALTKPAFKDIFDINECIIRRLNKSGSSILNISSNDFQNWQLF